MVRVVVAQEAGACFGVERALEMVKAEASSSSVPVHTLGPLIHNPQVVAELETMGVSVVSESCEAQPKETLFLRTHGVAPAMERDARESGLNVIDATCPFVKKVHKAAERLAAQGYQVIVVGEAGHPEVEGTLGHATGAVVVGSACDVDRIKVRRRVGLVVQTTLSVQALQEVVSALAGRCEELMLINTICDATSKRQAAAASLAAEADVMVVVGGRNSANTNHLADICAQRCERTHHIETPAEIESAWFEGAQLVGITAGASTPKIQIDEVREAVYRLAN